MGDLLKEQVAEMGPHFRYHGNIDNENGYAFDLSGTLMVTGWDQVQLNLRCFVGRGGPGVWSHRPWGPWGSSSGLPAASDCCPGTALLGRSRRPSLVGLG